MFTVDDEVIKTLGKLRLSSIKPFKKTYVQCHLKWREEKFRHVVRSFVLIDDEMIKCYKIILIWNH